jgi:hypothetical protein
MVLCNSLIILPRHSNKVGITIRDNLQGQEIMRLNNKQYNTIYSIKDNARSEGFIFEATGHQGESKWYLKTKENTINILTHFNQKFNTTYYLRDLEHYWLCPHCKSAVPDTWTSCSQCK